MQFKQFCVAAILAAASSGAAIGAQETSPAGGPRPPSEPAPVAAALPAGYVIGAEDVLSILFWRDKDMSADVVVRPDGKISLPLVNDVDAAGLTPDQLRERLTQVASKFIPDPSLAVVVKEIHSRKVFITGNVGKPGAYALSGDMNVVQLIALAGGLAEYADAKNIVVMRSGAGGQQSFKVNYKDVVKQKNVQQNISLKSGDTVIIP
jgi:polysaccharide export outer membrane protein